MVLSERDRALLLRKHGGKPDRDYVLTTNQNTGKMSLARGELERRSADFGSDYALYLIHNGGTAEESVYRIAARELRDFTFLAGWYPARTMYIDITSDHIAFQGFTRRHKVRKNRYEVHHTRPATATPVTRSDRALLDTAKSSQSRTRHKETSPVETTTPDLELEHKELASQASRLSQQLLELDDILSSNGPTRLTWEQLGHAKAAISMALWALRQAEDQLSLLTRTGSM